MPKLMSFAMTTQQMRDRDPLKTLTTRLPWGKGDRPTWSNLKPGDLLWAVEKAMGLKDGEEVKYVDLIRVELVYPATVGDITQEEVIEEGFPEWSPSDFVGYLLEHNRHATRATPCRRIRFSYTWSKAITPDMIDAATIRRWQELAKQGAIPEAEILKALGIAA